MATSKLTSHIEHDTINTINQAVLAAVTAAKADELYILGGIGMICTKCGHNNVDEALFCEECGNRLGAGASPQPGPAQQPYAAPQQQYAQQPYAQQPSMGQPYMAQPEKKGVGFAVTSMVCGILSLVLSCCIPYVPFVLALVGVVLGGVSLHGHRGGKGMAIAGLVTSIISLVPAVFVIIAGASIMASLGM